MGGYTIIDFKGVNITTTGVTIPGIYDAIEGTRKAIQLHNVQINSKEYHDLYPEIYISSSKYVFDVQGTGGDSVTIDADDKVTYVVE